MTTPEIEIGILKTVVNKLDQSLDKISSMSNDIGRLLAVHEERIANLEKVTDTHTRDIHFRIQEQTRQFIDKIDSVEGRLGLSISNALNEQKNHQTSISTELQAIKDRIDALERWKWYIAGGLGLIAFMIANADKLSTIAKIL